MNYILDVYILIYGIKLKNMEGEIKVSPNVIKYFIFGVFRVFGLIVIAYLIISKKMQSKETKYVAQLVEGTKKSAFNLDIILLTQPTIFVRSVAKSCALAWQ